MQPNKHIIDIDIKNPTYVDEPQVKQNDTVDFEINITDKGEPYDLTGVSTVAVAFERADGVSISYPITKSVGKVSFATKTSAVSVVGRTKLTVQMYDADGRISTFSFFIHVDKDPTGKYKPNDGESTLIEVVLGEGPLVIANAITATEEAIAAKDAAVLSKQAADDAVVEVNAAKAETVTATNTANERADYIDAKKPLIDKAITDSGLAKTTAETVETQFNRVIAETGDSTPEITQARGEFVNLNARMDDTATQLADKAKKVDIGTLTELKTTIKTNAVLAINESFDRQSMDIKQYLQEIRNKHIGKLSKVAFPTDFTWKLAPIQILSDGKNYVTYFNVAKFKNTGGITYYVDSINGQPANDGLTEATAFSTFKLALSVADDGDTIMILDTMLNRQSINGDNIVITKNINIIGKTKAVLKSSDKSTFVKTAGYTNVYEVTRSNVFRVVDYKKKYEFSKVNSIAEVDSTPGTYYTDNVRVYVHTLESTVPTDDTHFPLVAIGQFFRVDASTRDVNVYFENIEIVGGNCPLETVNSATSKPRLFMKNCGLYYNYSTTKGAPYVAGCDLAIFQNVETAYGYEDGFDYHSLNGVPSKFIEVDCKGHSNGQRNLPENFNGSTAHADCKGIRFGGYYYNNVGPNIADVQGVVETVNYEVSSFDSAALTWVNSAFQVYDNKQWLFNCKTFGCQYDIYVGSAGTMYVDNKTVYFKKLGSGTFVIES